MQSEAAFTHHRAMQSGRVVLHVALSHLKSLAAQLEAVMNGERAGECCAIVSYKSRTGIACAGRQETRGEGCSDW